MLRMSQDEAGELVFGKVGGVTLSAVPSAVVGSLVLWLLASLFGLRVLRRRAVSAAGLGLLFVLFHWSAEFMHQLGHAAAAASTGYPMKGIRAWGLFGASIYPPDEPELPPEIHIRRALGGPPVNVLLGLLALPVALKARRGSLLQLLSTIEVVQNLLIFGLGAFLPLGFTDGSTLWRWLPRLRRGDRG